MKKILVMLLVAAAGFTQEQQKPIQDLNLLIGKQVIVQRIPLCQPGTYTSVVAYAGKQALVVSLKPSTMLAAFPQTTMDRMPPAARAQLEDALRAATILVRFEDGTQLDTCVPIGPSKLSDYFELAPGQSLQPVAQGSPAPPPASAPLTSTVTTLAQDKPGASTPPSDGFYYKTSQGWQKLEQLSMAGGGLKHMGKMFVPGLTPQMVWTFRDAESPVQITDRRPTFYIKELPQMADIAGRTGRDLLIVRFDKKKDHRELQTTNGGNMFTFKAGLSKDHVPDITTKTVTDGVFIITPNQDLKPGEYMVTFSALGNSGYDFGIK